MNYRKDMEAMTRNLIRIDDAVDQSRVFQIPKLQAPKVFTLTPKSLEFGHINLLRGIAMIQEIRKQLGVGPQLAG
jgi:hypothetical protein